MLVSVIIPCYNSEHYIMQCINSIINQTYKDLEIIVIDDGSTDQTSSRVKSIDDERIKYYYKENGGISSARNCGIEKSTGECIAFLDSDDYWRSDKIEKQLTLIDKYDIIYSDYSPIDLNGASISPKAKINPLVPNYNLKQELLSKNAVLSSSSGVLLKKEIPLKIGLFNTALKIGEDWDYWARIAWANYSFGYIDEELVSIRCNEFSIQHTTSNLVWKKSVELLLNSFLLFPDISNRNRATIYKRLFINSYGYGPPFFDLVKYYLKIIQHNPSHIFDAQILFLFSKYYPRSVMRSLNFLNNKICVR